MTEPVAPVLRGDPFSMPLEPVALAAVPTSPTSLERHLVEAVARVSNAFHFMLHSDDEQAGHEALARILATLRTVEPVVLDVAPEWFPEWFADSETATDDNA